MDFQQIAVLLTFMGSIAYIIRRGVVFYRRKQCAGGCGGACSSIDFSKLKTGIK